MVEGSSGPVRLEDIRAWLEEGRDEADNLVDLKWVVYDEKRGGDGSLISFRASHPMVPVNLLVLLVSEGLGSRGPIMRLVVETGIPTVDLEPREKLKLYRSLLRMSRLPLSKFYLFGDDHEIGVAVDLDLRSLSKEEFDDALMLLSLAYLYLRELSPEIERAMRREEIDVLTRLVRNYIESGRSREEVVRILVDGGMPRDEAERIVSLIYDEEGRPRRRSPIHM